MAVDDYEKAARRLELAICNPSPPDTISLAEIKEHHDENRLSRLRFRCAALRRLCG